MNEQAFDLVVVGSGTGLDIASTLVGEGWRVAIVEKDAPGGTCLNRGCIPSKMLIHSADLVEEIRRAETFGIHARVDRIDFAGLMKRTREHVDGDSAGIGEALRESENPRFFAGTGHFVGEKRFRVNDVVLTAPKFLLATGARPKIPPIAGLEGSGYLTSTEALSRPTIPGSLIIVGGGYIAAELGHFFGALGTTITIIQRHDVLLPREDRDVRERFTEVFGKKHRLLLSSEATRVRREGARVHVEVETPTGTETLEADDLLVAVGLTPNSDTLDLDKVGIRTDARGYIAVDEFMETNVPGIFALGDAVGRHNLKHAANHEAQYVYNNLRSPEDKIALVDDVMPHAVFSSPQVAAVGATEEQLQQAGAPYLVGTYATLDTAMGKAIDDRTGFVKLLADKETERILGCHILGKDASTLIHEVVLAMTYGITTREIARTVHIHPALSEVVQRAAGEMRDPAHAHGPGNSHEHG